MWTELYESVMRAFIRFFDNRFGENNLMREIDYLKLEVEKERLEKRKLLDYIMELNKPIERAPDVSLDEFKPLSNQIPWRSKRMQLEKDDRKKFEDMKKEAGMKSEEMKSTEQLEAELLNIN